MYQRPIYLVWIEMAGIVGPGAASACHFEGKNGGKAEKKREKADNTGHFDPYEVAWALVHGYGG